MSPLVKHPFVTVRKPPVLMGMFLEAAARAQDASVRQYTVTSSSAASSPVALADVERVVEMAAGCAGCASASMSPSGSPLRSWAAMKASSSISGTPPDTEEQGAEISLKTSSSSTNPLTRRSFELQGSSGSGGAVMTKDDSNFSRDRSCWLEET